MDKKDLKFYTVAIAIILIDLSLLIYLNTDNDKAFLTNDWISVKDPIFYHYFSKKGTNYEVEIHDKSGDFASRKKNGRLSGDTLTFIDIDGSIDFYTYENGLIHIESINRNGKKNTFTPLKKVKNEYKK